MKIDQTMTKVRTMIEMEYVKGKSESYRFSIDLKTGDKYIVIAVHQGITIANKALKDIREKNKENSYRISYFGGK
jgi:hypothetical protein